MASEAQEHITRCTSLGGERDLRAGNNSSQYSSSPGSTRFDKPQLFVYLDVEANGPIPGEYSMLSFAAVAFESNADEQFKEVSSYSANLHPLHNRVHPSQQAFWDRHPEAFQATLVNRKSPIEAMKQFSDFVLRLQERYHVFPISWPAAFDWQFLNYYLHRFTGRNPLGYNCLDHGSYMWAFFGTERATDRWDLQPYEAKQEGHKHIAIHDARSGARLFHSIYQEHRRQLSAGTALGAPEEKAEEANGQPIRANWKNKSKKK